MDTIARGRQAASSVAADAEVIVEIDLDRHFGPLVDELAEVSAERARLEKVEKRIKAELIAQAPLDAKAQPKNVKYVLRIAGVVRGKISKREREGVDAKLLKETFPEAYEAAKTSSGFQQYNPS